MRKGHGDSNVRWVPLTLAFGTFCLVAQHGPASSSPGQTLMISPGTLVLDSTRPGGTVIVGVTGNNSAVVEVSNAFFLQNTDGGLSSVDPATSPRSAAAFIRAGPRRFTILPGQGTQLRVAVRPPAGLPQGEYRLHLRIELVRKLGARAPDQEAKSETKQVGINVPIRVALGARILYRHKVKPEGGRVETVTARTEGQTVVVSFDIIRLGETSLLAKYQVIARYPSGAAKPIGPAGGISLYPEHDHRRFTMKLDRSLLDGASQVCIRLAPNDIGNADLAPHENCAASLFGMQ